LSLLKLDTETRREQIAHACVEVVGEEGFDSLSVAKVARKIGLVPSALYRHYDSKYEMVTDMLHIFMDMAQDMLNEVMQKEKSALRRLRAIIIRENEIMSEDKMFMRFLLSDRVISDPVLCGKIREIGDKYSKGIQEIIIEGQKAGEITSETDAETLAMLFQGVTMPPGMKQMISWGNYDAIKQIEKNWKFFERAIKA